MDRIKIVSVESLPRGTPLERSLRPRKKRRAWEPVKTTPEPDVLVFEHNMEVVPIQPKEEPIEERVASFGTPSVVNEAEQEPEPFLVILPSSASVNPTPEPDVTVIEHNVEVGPIQPKEEPIEEGVASIGTPSVVNEAEQEPETTPEPFLVIPLSPATFPECASTPVRSPLPPPDQPRSSPRRRARPRRPLRGEDIEEHNYGSESGGSDSEEEDLVPMLASRVLLGAMDTPLDEEEGEPEPPAATLADASEGALRPTDIFHFEWRPFPDPPIPPTERREPFTQAAVGPAEPCQDPYTIFVSIWGAQIMERIVVETNRYAQDVALRRLHENSLGPKSRICDWKDTCIDELYTYFAIILSMGIVIKTKIEEYWTADCEIFSTPGFRAHMTLSRFQLLNACLHFNNNADMRGRDLSPAEARLFKIEPIITHLNAKFQSMYTMGRNIALDESMMQWKGWLNINQFIANKVAKVGVKTYEVCESQTGYLWRFSVHAGKHTPQGQTPLDAATPTIVLELLRGLEGKGYTVWMDNFYNSPALARHLKILGFDAVGTLRTNRQFVPQELSALTKSNMQKGQIAGLTSGDVDILVWRDENRVATISTYHGNETGVCEDKVKPCVVLDYNIMMGGVDKKDQLLSMYPIERKRTTVWYKKFFRRLLNVSVLNSYIIAKKSGSSAQHRNFRKSLIQSLLSRHSAPKKMPLLVESSVFQAKKHHILEYPVGANKSRLRRKCCLCKHLTHFYCAGCEKTVCISTCFVNLHS